METDKVQRYIQSKMIKTFNKFSCAIQDQIGDYVFDGVLFINGEIRNDTIDGVLGYKNKEIAKIIVRINLDNNTISRNVYDVTQESNYKEIIDQFIDRILTEANRQYTAYITALNS